MPSTQASRTATPALSTLSYSTSSPDSDRLKWLDRYALWTEIVVLEDMHDHWLPSDSLVQQVCQQQLKNDKALLVRKQPLEIAKRLNSMRTADVPTYVDELAPLPYEVIHGGRVPRSARTGILALQQVHQSRQRLQSYYYTASVRYECLNPHFARLLLDQAHRTEVDAAILRTQIQANPRTRRYLVCDPSDIPLSDKSVMTYLR